MVPDTPALIVSSHLKLSRSRVRLCCWGQALQALHFLEDGEKIKDYRVTDRKRYIYDISLSILLKNNENNGFKDPYVEILYTL